MNGLLDHLRIFYVLRLSEVSEELSDVGFVDSVKLIFESAVSSVVFSELSVSLGAVIELSIV